MSPEQRAVLAQAIEILREDQAEWQARAKREPEGVMRLACETAAEMTFDIRLGLSALVETRDILETRLAELAKRAA